MNDEEREELEQKAHDYKGLVKHPGWIRLTETAGQQVKIRENMLLTDTDDSLEGWARSRRLLGERIGIKTILATPETLIEELEELLNDE